MNNLKLIYKTYFTSMIGLGKHFVVTTNGQCHCLVIQTNFQRFCFSGEYANSLT